MTSNHYTPNGGKNSSGQGWQYNDNNGKQNHTSGQGGSQPPKKPGFNIGEWIPIIVLFCIPSGVTQLIAFFWALSKVINLVKRNKEYQEHLRKFGNSAVNVTRDMADAVRKEVNSFRDTSPSAKTTEQKSASSAKTHNSTAKTTSQSFSYAGTGKPSPAKKGKKVRGGTALVVLGIIFACGCGLPALITLLAGAFEGFSILMIFVLAGLGMLFGGIGLNRRKERFLNYLAYIGTNTQVNLAHMAASFGIPVRKLCKDLRKMLADGILPTGYLDLAAGKLFLTEEGYRAPMSTVVEEKTSEEIQKAEDDILREIRRINDEIPDEVMSAKIDRIEEITGKILAYQKSHPDRSGQLRSFLNYYLPTTLKILRAYAQLDAQGIEGENISATKARIEGMMDQVVAGFEKQLDKLFHNDAMDISSDVQVLENMLKKDGLSDDSGGITMTL